MARRLSSEEFAFFFMILAVAGNETTRQAITHGMLALLQHPGSVGTVAPRTAGHHGRRGPALGIARGGPAAHGYRGHCGRRSVGAAGASGWACTSLPPTSTRRPSTTRGASTSAVRPIPRHLRRRRLALLHRGQPLPPGAAGDVRRPGGRAGRRAIAGPACAACARRGSTGSSNCPSTTERSR